MGKRVDPAKGKSEIEGRFTALAGVGRPQIELTVVRPTGGDEWRVGGLVCLLKIKRSPRFPAIPPSRGSSWPLAMAARLAINKAEGSASAQRQESAPRLSRPAELCSKPRLESDAQYYAYISFRLNLDLAAFIEVKILGQRPHLVRCSAYNFSKLDKSILQSDYLS